MQAITDNKSATRYMVFEFRRSMRLPWFEVYEGERFSFPVKSETQQARAEALTSDDPSDSFPFALGEVQARDVRLVYDGDSHAKAQQLQKAGNQEL